MSAHQQKLLSSANILLVEDNLTNQLVAVEFLKGLDVNVVIANNGEEALELFARREFDLILMDLQMPLMDGIEATKRIRRNAKGEQIPILAMSAATMPEDIEAAQLAGVNAHLAKPIDFNALTTSILDWLNYTQGFKQRAGYVLGSESSHFDIIGLELDMAVAKLGNNWNILSKAIQQFIYDSQNLLQELDEAIETQDKIKCLHLMHTYKGMLATIGAYQQASNADQLEQQIKLQKDCNFDELKQQHHTLLQAIEASNWRAPIASVAEIDTTIHDPLTTIRQLLTNFKDGTFVTAEEISIMAPSLRGIVEQSDVDKLIELVDQLDYFAAAKLLTPYVERS